MAYNFKDKEYVKDRGTNAGMLTDPTAWGADTVEGILHGGAKVAYDYYSVGNDIQGGINSAGLNPFEYIFDYTIGDPSIQLEDPDYKLDIGENYFDAIKDLDRSFEDLSPTTKGFAELTSLAVSTRAIASNLANWGKFKTLIESSSKWNKLRGLLYTGAIAEVPTSLIHTRSSDGSIFSLLPKEYHNDLTSWFIDRTDDSELEGRFKNAIEGIGIGSAFEIGFATIGKILRVAKDSVHKGLGPNAQGIDHLMAMDSIVGNGNGDVITAFARRNTTVGRTMDEKMGIFTDNIQTGKNVDTQTLLWRHNEKAKVAVLEEAERIATKERKIKLRAPKSKKARKRNALARQADNHAKIARNPEYDIEYTPIAIEAAEPQIIKDGADGVYEYMSIPPVTPRTAAEYRVVADDYSVEQIFKEQRLKDVTRQKIDVRDEETAKSLTKLLSDSNRDVLEESKRLVLDPKANPKHKKLAQRIIADSKTPGGTRLNVETSGAANIAGSSRFAHILATLSGLKLKKHKPRTRLKIALDAHEKWYSDELRIPLEKMSDEFGYNKQGLRAQLINFDIAAEAGVDIITVARTQRVALEDSVRQMAGSLDVNVKNLRYSEDFNNLMYKLSELDEMDSLLEGSIGNVGTILGMQQWNPSDMGKNLDAAHKSIQDRLAAAGKGKKSGVTKAEVKTLKRREAAIRVLLDSIDDPNEAALRAFVKRLANKSLGTKKAVEDVFKAPRLMDYFHAYVLGGAISNPATLFGAVIGGGVASTAYKQFAVKSMEAVVSPLIKRVGFGDAGATMADVAISAKVGFEQTWKATTNLFAGKQRKTMRDLMNLTTDTSREGVHGSGSETMRSIRDSWKATALQYHAEGRYKTAALVNLITPLTVPVGKVLSVTTGFIGTADDFFKGINSKIQLRSEAERTWYRDGGDEVFRPLGISKEDFVNDFHKLQIQVQDLQRSDIPAKDFEPALRQLTHDDDILADKVLDSLKSAVKIGEEVTLQGSTRELLGGDIMRGLNKATGDSNLGRLTQLSIAMFQKTPVVALQEVLENAGPTALVTKSFWKGLKTGSPEDKVRVISKMATGILAITGISALATTDIIQGSYATPGDRAAGEAAGRLEHSINIGGISWQYSRLGPAASFITTGADMNAWSIKNAGDLGLTSMRHAQAFAIASEDSYIQTIVDIIDIVQSDEVGKDTASFTFDKINRMLVPAGGLAKALGDQVDREKGRTSIDREIEGFAGFIQHTMAKGLKNNVLAQAADSTLGTGIYKQEIDLLGKGVNKYAEGPIPRLLHLLGVSNSNIAKDPFSTKAYSLNLLPARHSNHVINNAIINTNDYKELMKFGREGVNGTGFGIAEMNAFTQNLIDRNYNDYTIKEMLGKAMKKREKYLKQLLFESSPELQRKAFLYDLGKLNEGYEPADEDDGEAWRTARSKRLEMQQNTKTHNKLIKDLSESELMQFNEFRKSRNPKKKIKIKKEAK